MANSTGLILGISGLAGSGKDRAADILVEACGFVKISLADRIKQIAVQLYDFSDEQLWGPSQFRNAGDPRYIRADGTLLSPRIVCQKLGTEVGRECWVDTWTLGCLRTANQLLEDGGIRLKYTQKFGLAEHNGSGRTRSILGVVIPDVRFLNELMAIKAAGGKVIRIVRPGAGLDGTAGAHVSETEQADIPDSDFDYVIHNAGTLEDLRTVVLETAAAAVLNR